MIDMIKSLGVAVDEMHACASGLGSHFVLKGKKVNDDTVEILESQTAIAKEP